MNEKVHQLYVIQIVQISFISLTHNTHTHTHTHTHKTQDVWACLDRDSLMHKTINLVPFMEGMDIIWYCI